MKTTFAIIAVLSALLVPQMRASAADSSDVSAEEQLYRIDLSIALKQYEKVRQMLEDAKLEREPRTEPETQEQQIAAVTRIKTLQNLANTLRKRVIDCQESFQKTSQPPK